MLSSPHSVLLTTVKEENGNDLKLVEDQMWVCLHVKSGTEFKTALFLLRNRIAFFLPLRLHSNNAFRPLWTNYMFCRVDVFQKSRLRRRFDVMRILIPPDEEELLLHLRQLSPISRIVPYEVDDHVRVKTGALEGFSARIDQVEDEAHRVKISINLLGKTVQVARDYEDVEMLAPARPSKRPITLTPVEKPQPPVSESEAPSLPEPSREAINLHLEAISKEFIKYLARHPNQLYELEPRRFEILVAELLSDMGYEVELTPESRDGGRDILAAFTLPHGKILTLVECKRFRPDRKVGIDILERFLWVLDRKDKASCGLIATTSYFSSDAIATEREYQWRLRLRDFDGLQEWLSKYGSWTRNTGLGLWLPASTKGLVQQ